MTVQFYVGLNVSFIDNFFYLKSVEGSVQVKKLLTLAKA